MQVGATGTRESNWAAVQHDMTVGVAALLVLFAWVTWVQQLSSMAEDLNVLLLVSLLSALCLWLALRRHESPASVAAAIVACTGGGTMAVLLAPRYAHAAPFPRPAGGVGSLSLRPALGPGPRARLPGGGPG